MLITSLKALSKTCYNAAILVKAFSIAKLIKGRRIVRSKLTLREISKAAGVSVTTVSRVLNDHPNVSNRVRARVKRVIEETGYQPNPAARSLAGGKNRIIGLVIPETTHFLFSDPYFSRLIRGVASACRRYDYTLSLFLFDAIEDKAKLASRVINRQLLDGLILTATTSSDPLVEQLFNAKVPLVLIGRHEHPTIHFVDADNESGAYSAVAHLLNQGYNRIATITGPLKNDAAVQRKNGYLRALQDRGVTVEPTLMVEADFTGRGGQTAMTTLLPHKPDAVFVASDRMAQGALSALRQAGLTVPDDMGLVAYDDLPLAAQSVPPLTTVRQPIAQSGIVAVETLLDILQSGPEPPRRIVLPTELVIRASSQMRKPLNLEEVII